MTDYPPAIMLTHAVKYGQSSLKVIAGLLEASETVFHAGTLCRPFYELSLRLLWAAREPNGWERLQAYWAREDKRFAERVLDYDPQCADAQQTRAKAETSLERRDENGKPFSPAPDVRSMLLQTEKRDLEQDIKETGTRFGHWQYAYIYLYLSRHVHAHLTGIDNPNPDMVLNIATLVAIQGTFLLLQALCHFAVDDIDRLKSVIQSIEGPVCELLEGCDELSFDGGTSSEKG